MYVEPSDSLVSEAKKAQETETFLDIDISRFVEWTKHSMDDIFMDSVNVYISKSIEEKQSKTERMMEVGKMNKTYNSFDIDELNKDFSKMAYTKLSALDIVGKDKSFVFFPINKKLDVESLWVPIDHYVHDQYEKNRPDLLNIAPIVSGQLSAYAGIVLAILAKRKPSDISTNVLHDDRYEVNDEGRAIYNFLNIDFVSPFEVDLEEAIDQATEIEDLQKFFLKYIGLSYDSEEEVNLRGALNNIFAEFYIKCHDVAKSTGTNNPFTIINNSMKMMIKLGMSIGSQKF